jgi:glycerol-3-phosphate dehydrogenase
VSGADCATLTCVPGRTKTEDREKKVKVDTQMDKLRVAVVGSGSWGTVIGKILAENVGRLEGFDSVVPMWTFEEKLPDGRLLSRVINEEHENVKYSPGLRLPASLRAVTDVGEATRGASHLVFVLPHQFLERTVRQIAAAGLRPGVRAISLIKVPASARVARVCAHRPLRRASPLTSGPAPCCCRS